MPPNLYIHAKDRFQTGEREILQQIEQILGCIETIFLSPTPQHNTPYHPQSFLPFSNKQHTSSDHNQAQSYFLEVFLAVFFELLAFESFELFLAAFSSFLAALLAIATCFTIFCSSTRNARRMLHTHSRTQFLTDRARTCGTDFHHTHGTQCAGSESRSSDR